MSCTPHPTARRRSLAGTPRWLVVLAVVSLSLNLLVAGAVAARIYYSPFGFSHMRHAMLARPGALHIAARRLLRRLPRDRAQALRGLAERYRRDLRARFGAVADARLRLARILARQPFDEAAYKAALDEVRASERNAHSTASALTEAFIRALTPEERGRYADILRSPGQHGWWRHHRR